MKLRNVQTFFVKLDPEEVENLLEKLDLTTIKVKLWEKEAPDTILEEFKFLGYDNNEKNLYISPLKETCSLESKHVIYHLRCDKLQYLSSGTLVKDPDPEKDQYKIKLEGGIYKFERRKHFRVDVLPPFKATLKVNETDYPVADIAIGGLGLDVTKDQYPFFVDAKILYNFHITVNEKVYDIFKAYVRYVKKIGDNCFRVGLEFSELNTEIESTLYVDIHNILYRIIEEEKIAEEKEAEEARKQEEEKTEEDKMVVKVDVD